MVIRMTTNDTVSIALLLAIGSFVIAILNVVISARKERKELETEKLNATIIENQKQLDIEKNFVKINTKLDDFVETTKQMMRDNERKTDDLRVLSENMIKVNERVETLFKYKDDHERRISDLEDKVK